MAPSIEILVRNNILVSVFVQILLLTRNVQGYYCEWNLCETDQYCCGDNQCCNDVYSTWYFWTGVVFFILMLLSFGGFFRYSYALRSQTVHQITNFMPVTTDVGCPEEMEGLVAYSEDFEISPNYPSETIHTKSPPYKEVTQCN